MSVADHAPSITLEDEAKALFRLWRASEQKVTVHPTDARQRVVREGRERATQRD